MLSYLLLDVNPVLKEDVKKELMRYDHTVDTVRDIAGSTKVVAKVVTDDEESLREFIARELRGILGLKNISTISKSS